ncbi:hypothetical protein DXG01_011999 [Tephrocybe rancida]|nr:hypothetical protein DXG01_011999 [Tephrocybe rancida]
MAHLAPLALSPTLSTSLILIATHTPPPVPPSPQASIIILHLPAPLAIHDSGAVRLAALLDRAQRVAHSFHTSPPQAHPRVQQLAELYPGGDFSIAEEPEFALPVPVPASPTHAHTAPSSRASSLSSHSSASSSISSIRSTAHSTKKSKINKAQLCPFSALLNFLPPALPDKALLKHSILVTTLAAPFLGPPSASPSNPSPYNTKRSSTFFSSLSLASTSQEPLTAGKPEKRRSRITTLFTSTPPSSFTQSRPPSLFASSRESLAPPSPSSQGAGVAHIIHILPYSSSPSSPPHPHRSSTSPSPSSLTPPPPNTTTTNRRSFLPPSHLHLHTQAQGNTKSKLVQGIEQFLLSFAYPPSAAASVPSLPSLSTLNAPALAGSNSLPPVPTPPAGMHMLRAPVRSSPLASPSGSPGGSPSGSINLTTRRSSALYAPPSGAHAFMGVGPPEMGHGGQGMKTKVVPYLLPAGTLGSYPLGATRCVGELILEGVLDSVAAGVQGDGEVGTGKEREREREEREGWPRAWIGGRAEVVLVREQEQEQRGVEVHAHAHAPGDAPARKDPKKRRRTRRNEAGLPTPPQSSTSSTDSDSGSSSSHEHEHESTAHHLKKDIAPEPLGHHRERYSQSEPHFPPSAVAGKLMKAKAGAKAGVRLRARVSRFFGLGGARVVV